MIQSHEHQITFDTTLEASRELSAPKNAQIARFIISCISQYPQSNKVAPLIISYRLLQQFNAPQGIQLIDAIRLKADPDDYRAQLNAVYDHINKKYHIERETNGRRLNPPPAEALKTLLGNFGCKAVQEVANTAKKYCPAEVIPVDYVPPVFDEGVLVQAGVVDKRGVARMQNFLTKDKEALQAIYADITARAKPKLAMAAVHTQEVVERFIYEGPKIGGMH